jgi:hypothetical protein
VTNQAASESTVVDLDRLQRTAQECLDRCHLEEGPWYTAEDVEGQFEPEEATYLAAFGPSVALALIAEIRALRDTKFLVHELALGRLENEGPGGDLAFEIERLTLAHVESYMLRGERPRADLGEVVRVLREAREAFRATREQLAIAPGVTDEKLAADIAIMVDLVNFAGSQYAREAWFRITAALAARGGR